MQRAATVGSSDVPAILGLSPWQTPGQAWARLVGLVPRYSTGDTPATRRGRLMEAALLAEYARSMGVAVTPGPAITSPAPTARWGAWAHARADGLAAGRIVEVKTARALEGWADGELVEGRIGDGLIPDHYEAQVAWQCAVLDRPADVIAMGMATDEIRIYRLERDLGLEMGLIEMVRAWMQRHVWCDPPAPPDGTDAAILARVHAAPSRDWLTPTDEDLAAAREVADIARQERALKARRDALTAQLCARIGDAYGLRGVARWSPRKGRETIDARALRTAHPDIYRRFVRAGEPGRTFALLEETDR